MKQQLWLRLKRYHFEDLVPAHLSDHVAAVFGGPDPSTRAFASKLARKLGWSTDFAVRAIEEYKKFVYLGVTSDFSVTPSKVIDQVWHEHLLFSRAYRQFCADVLGRDFDHHPELVPTAEQTSAFQAQYEATLARYEFEFSVAPPADIWCTPKFVADGARKRSSPQTRKPASGDEWPLHLQFTGPAGGHPSTGSLPEFGGGGGFSGGGAERSWGAESGGDDGAAAGDAGGGSGCSSSCGGGCGGE